MMSSPPPSIKPSVLAEDKSGHGIGLNGSRLGSITEEEAVILAESLFAKFLSASVGGLVQATLLQPVDQALYLAVLNQKELMHRSNWVRPYLNFTQSVLLRVGQSGSYFFLQMIYDDYLARSVEGLGLPRLGHALAAGIFVGTLNGILTNPLSCVKHYSIELQSGYTRAARSMFAQGGVHPFLRGVRALMLRDTVFAFIYEPLKLRRDGSQGQVSLMHSVLHNSSVGFLGAVVSSPFNFAQKVQYGHPKSLRAPNVLGALVDVYKEIRLTGRPFYEAQRRMAIGWGSVRCGVGIAINQLVSDQVRSMLDPSFHQ